MTTHILLVSKQAAPNLLPALDPALKPDEAVLLVSRSMTAQADNLTAVLTEAGIKVTRIELQDEHDYGQLSEALLNVAAQREGQTLVLNVTGGTKLMALAAQSVAQAAGWQAFYVDADTDEVIWLNAESRRQPLAQQLRLRHYLRGYGFTLPQDITRPPAKLRHANLIQTLLRQIGSLEVPLSQLNWIGQVAEDAQRLQAKLTPAQQDSRSLEALLRNFEDAGVLTVQGENLLFSSEADRDFAKGGWLEAHVFQTVSEQTNALGIRDKAANLKVQDLTGVHNELDVAFLARNRLFVIECKTARMDKPEAPKANDALYKLTEISRRVGGLGTQCMLASYRPLRDTEKRLAKALHIEIVCGEALTRLPEKLKAWVRPN